MNYCEQYCQLIKRMCNSVKPLLPSEYQQAEYVQSSSTYTGPGTAFPYFEIGLAIFADFEIDCQKLNNEYGVICGIGREDMSRGLDTPTYYRLLGPNSSRYVTNIPITGRAKIKWKDNDIYINDNYITTLEKDFVQGDFALFGNGGYSAYKYTNMRIYSFRAWNSDGTIIRDMYPCYRKSDNAVGFYDIVGDGFYAQTGSNYWAQITVGPNV